MFWTLMALVGFITVMYTVMRPTKRLPDGPRSLPFVGNLFDMKGTPIHKKLAQWATIYGPFFCYQIGPTPAIVLSSPETLEELCVKRGHIYSSRPKASNQAEIITGKFRIVNMPYGDEFRSNWKKRRKIIHKLLGIHNAKMFLPYQEYESKITMLNLLNEPDQFFTEMGRYSGSVTFSLLLAARFGKSDALIPQRIAAEMLSFFNNIRPGAWLVDWIPILDKLPDALAPWRAKARTSHRQMVQFWGTFYNHINECINNGTAPDCFATRLLTDDEAKLLSETEKIMMIAEILTAGTETTATALQWFFKAAVLYPETISRAQDEIDGVVGRNRIPDWEDQVKLPYIEAIINETHRWASATPLAFFHSTTDSDTYQGKTIPKGSTIIPNTYSIHHSSEYFSDPDDFIPERYLPPDHPYFLADAAFRNQHFAFGVGRRECPGRHVAHASLYIVISRILWAFNICAIPSSMPSSETVGAPPVLGPKPFKCSITPRSDATADLIRRNASSGSTVELEDASIYEKYMPC
ncbi:cytochrome P450 [Xylogone sp. PMI_703]|nr:cytochrome P450 [Xylogone sp. PMI_703]